jgi:L-2-hydroxyglutarate oxidase LhgO
VGRACEIQRIHRASHRRIRDLTNRVEQCGSLMIGLTDLETDDLRRSYEMMKANGFQVEWLESASSGLRESKPACHI